VCSRCRNGGIAWAAGQGFQDLPQHFLYFFPLPQVRRSFGNVHFPHLLGDKTTRNPDNQSV
jgi:hypothetical protein